MAYFQTFLPPSPQRPTRTVPMFNTESTYFMPNNPTFFIPQQIPQQPQPQQQLPISTIAKVGPDDDDRVINIASVNRWHLNVGAGQTRFATLDMSGVNLRVLPPALFGPEFSQITSLYLGDNKLSVFPIALTKMTQLQCLHLERNALTDIPREIQCLRELRELDLSNNQLTKLPPELGCLWQLLSLNLAGNRFEYADNSFLNQDVPVIVRRLLDKCEFPQDLMIEREWRMEQFLEPNKGPVFRIMTYNILAEVFCNPHFYGYCPTKHLSADYRRTKVLEQIRKYDPDILCLQEVDRVQYDKIKAELHPKGFESYFEQKTRTHRMRPDEVPFVDGSATFWRADKFKLVESCVHSFQALSQKKFNSIQGDKTGFFQLNSKEHIAVATVLETKTSTPKRFALSNTHTFWDPAYSYIKLMQAQMQIEEISELQKKHTTDPAHPLPLILAGDYNSTPTSGVYQLFSTGNVPADHPDWMKMNFGKYTSEGISNSLSFVSAYHTNGEPEYTNCGNDYVGCLDYIWMTPESFRPIRVLDVIPMAQLDPVLKPFPNPAFPSDHVPLVADIQML